MFQGFYLTRRKLFQFKSCRAPFASAPKEGVLRIRHKQSSVRFYVSLTAAVVTVCVTANAYAMGRGGGKGGGGNDGGDTSFTCEAAEFFVVPGDLVTRNEVDGSYRLRNYAPIDTTVEERFENFLNAIGEPLPPQKSCIPPQDPLRYGFIAEDPTTPELISPLDHLGYTLVFSDEFPSSPDNPDLSNTFNSLKWSSKYPFSTDAKFNTIPGEDDHWNVNTTGRYPGETNYNPEMGVPPSNENFFNNTSELDYLDTLFDIPNYGNTGEPQAPVFSNSDEILSIAAYENPAPLRLNDNKPYLSGLISSAANPDLATSANVHGFEFRYGYVEASVKLPLDGNGFRAALWLYSDNAFFNQVSSDNNITHEIDFMEYLPNTREMAHTMDAPRYDLQTSLFGGVDNLSAQRNEGGWNIMTYGTIFHAYHYDNNARRTPTNWTFNGEARYQDRRAVALGEPVERNGTTDTAVLPPADSFHKFAVLWLPEKIEWYVNDVLIHRAVPPDSDYGGEDPGFQAVVDIFDKRMYIIANLAMGLDGFEGPMDTSVYDADTGKGPTFEIDYIRVYQDTVTPGSPHIRCGFGTDIRCNKYVDLVVPEGGGDTGGGGGGPPPGKGKNR